MAPPPAQEYGRVRPGTGRVRALSLPRLPARTGARASGLGYASAALELAARHRTHPVERPVLEPPDADL